MIEKYRKLLGFSKTFSLAYKRYCKEYRTEYYLYGDDYLSSALYLAIQLKDEIQNWKLFLTCLLLNGYSTDRYNLGPLPDDTPYKQLLRAWGRYSDREIGIILNILNHTREDLVYIEDAQRDFELFNDFREYFKILILPDGVLVRHLDGIGITSNGEYSQEDYLRAVKRTIQRINNPKVKAQYLAKVNRLNEE